MIEGAAADTHRPGTGRIAWSRALSPAEEAELDELRARGPRLAVRDSGIPLNDAGRRGRRRTDSLPRRVLAPGGDAAALEAAGWLQVFVADGYIDLDPPTRADLQRYATLADEPPASPSASSRHRRAPASAPVRGAAGAATRPGPTPPARARGGPSLLPWTVVPRRERLLAERRAGRPAARDAAMEATRAARRRTPSGCGTARRRRRAAPARAQHLGAALGVVDRHVEDEAAGGGEQPADVVPRRRAVDGRAEQGDAASRARPPTSGRRAARRRGGPSRPAASPGRRRSSRRSRPRRRARPTDRRARPRPCPGWWRGSSRRTSPDRRRRARPARPRCRPSIRRRRGGCRRRRGTPAGAARRGRADRPRRSTARRSSAGVAHGRRATTHVDRPGIGSPIAAVQRPRPRRRQRDGHRAGDARPRCHAPTPRRSPDRPTRWRATSTARSGTSEANTEPAATTSRWRATRSRNAFGR